jgi:HEAT repeat protein
VKRFPLCLLALTAVASAVTAQESIPQPAQGPPPPATAPAVEEAPPLWTRDEEAAIQLLRSLRKKERPTDQELAARLSLGGQRLLTLYFDVLAARRVPALGTGEMQILSEIQEHAILLACAEFERKAVLGHVDAVTLAGLDLARRTACVALIGAAGRANDFPQLFGLALSDEEQALEKRMEQSLRHAVSSILLRDPRGVEQLVSLRRITRPELFGLLVEAVGATRDPKGLAYLSEVAYWSEGSILDVMGQVPLLGPSGDEGVDNAMRVRLRSYLDESRPGHCRAAITALTALSDENALAPLITLLASENSGLRENAHWALRQLTGLSMAPSADVWGRWHQGEQYWCLRSKPREFQRLRLSDPAEVADALRTILSHPLARVELVTALPDLLKSPWPALRVLACRTLGELSSREAVGRLVWALEDPEPDVVAAAHAALRKLTHLDLPSEAVAWQAATRTDPRGTEL